MKKRYVALFLCFLFLSSSFLGIGYAALSDQLDITGEGSLTPGKYVYIVDATVTSGSAQDIARSGTVLSSTVTLGNSTSSQTVIHVRVKNNTDYPYIYNGITYEEGQNTYDNTAIAVSSSIKKGVEVASGAYTEFDVIFKYKSGVSANKTLHSVIDLSFVPPAEYVPEIAVKGAIGRFGECLNNPTTYGQLTSALNNTSLGGRLSNTYIGNVVGATDADTATVNDLFTVDGKNLLTLEINGKETNVTAMIKHSNIGGTNDNEMVIYMTGETITGNLFRPGTVQVFAAVYTKNAQGVWVQKGELFEGEATTNAYYVSYNHNSFNTDTWKSTQSYYGLGKGATIGQLFDASPSI